MEIKIVGKLPLLNAYINSCRANKFAANKMKQDVQDIIEEQLPDIKIKTPCSIHFIFSRKSDRADVDGIAFGMKFILDAMVNKGMIEDDSQKYVKGFSVEFMKGEYETTLIIKEALSI